LVFVVNNYYISRIVGKKGNTLKALKIETDTAIDIRKQGDWTDEHERIVTINGELNNCMLAFNKINEIIRQTFEYDTISYAKLRRLEEKYDGNNSLTIITGKPVKGSSSAPAIVTTETDIKTPALIPIFSLDDIPLPPTPVSNFVNLFAQN
jgi:hypothetical protein